MNLRAHSSWHNETVIKKINLFTTFPEDIGLAKPFEVQS